MAYSTGMYFVLWGLEVQNQAVGRVGSVEGHRKGRVPGLFPWLVDNCLPFEHVHIEFPFATRIRVLTNDHIRSHSELMG